MSWWSFAGAVVDGVASVPMDAYYGSRRTLEDFGAFGAQVQKANAEERERVLNLIRRVIDNHRYLERLVKIVIDDFSRRLSDDSIEKLQQRAANIGLTLSGRMSTQFIISTFLGRELVRRIALTGVTALVARVGVGLALSALLVQGLVERASNASQSLQRVNPRVSRQLRDVDLDMLYFLVEDSLAPFVAFDGSDEAFEAILNRLDGMR